MEPQGTFGPRLRQERERRQISLKSIAANTKISQSLLEALERDDVSRWPSGIFRRAFIRSYATAIGLDADDIVKEFAERFPEPGQAQAKTEEPHGQGDGGQRPVAGHENAPHASATDRVDLVFRISVPRFLAPWLNRLGSRTAPTTPRGQST
jgi:transcriptional regulator with XRE-family HTH domain